MNCRFCGAKLGLMERWRYGDFCSQEHKSDFSNETQRLVQERLMSMHKPARGSSTNILFVDDPVVPEPVETEAEETGQVEVSASPQEAEVPQEAGLEALAAAPPAVKPDPEIQEFVIQSVIAPVPPAPAVPPAEPPQSKASRRDWKYLAKVADFDALPVMINTGASRLFRTITVVDHWTDATFSLPAGRLVFVPEPFQPEMRAAKAQMPSAELRPRDTYQGQSWATVPDPVTVPRSTWVDDTGRRWVYSTQVADPADYPVIGEVLEEYPLAAPWTSWPDWMLEEGKGTWTPPGSARQAGMEPSASQRPAAGGSARGAAQTVPPEAQAQEFKLAPMAPAAPTPRGLRRPASARSAGADKHGSGGNLEAGAVPSGESSPAAEGGFSGNSPAGTRASSGVEGRSGPGGAGGPGLAGPEGATPGVGKSASGGGGRGGSGSGSGSGSAAGSAAGTGKGGPGGRRSAGGKWQPIVPPIFHALIDIAHDMTPMRDEASIYGFVLWPFRPRDCQPTQPGARMAVVSRLSPGETGQRALPAAEPVGCDFAAPAQGSTDSVWPRHGLALPRLTITAGKPGLPPLPRHVALRLPLMDRWNPQSAEPALFLGANSGW